MTLLLANLLTGYVVQSFIKRPQESGAQIDVHICPKSCFCRPIIETGSGTNLHELYAQTNQLDPRKIIDYYEWIVRCENASVSTLASDLIHEKLGFSLVSLPRKTTELSLRYNKIVSVDQGAFSALPELEIL